MPFQSSHGMIEAHYAMDSQFSLEDIDNMDLERLTHWWMWEQDVGGLSTSKIVEIRKRLFRIGIDPNDRKSVERLNDYWNKEKVAERKAKEMQEKTKQKKQLSALLGKRITKIAVRDNCIEITLEGVIVMTFSYDGGYCPDMMIDGDGVV